MNVSKGFAMVVAMSLICTSLALQPPVNAHSPAWSIPTQAYLNITPNLIVLGQQTTINFGLSEPPPTANGTYGDRWNGMNIYVWKPDGTLDWQGSIISNEFGNATLLYSPDQVGNYSFWLAFEGQTLAGNNLAPGTTSPFIGDYYQPSNSSVFVLTVQSKPVNPTPSPTTTLTPTPTPTPSPINFGPTSSPTPSPSIPEFSWLAILPLFASLLFIAMVVKHRNRLKPIDQNLD